MIKMFIFVEKKIIMDYEKFTLPQDEKVLKASAGQKGEFDLLFNVYKNRANESINNATKTRSKQDDRV